MIVELNYDWVLEGDLDIAMSLVLCCDCVIKGLALHSVSLRHVDCENITFSLKRHTLCCDRFDSQPGLPIDLRNWFIARFRQHYADSLVIQAEVRDLVEGQAISAHWDAKSAA